MKNKKLILILVILTSLFLSGCSSSKNFGQRKAPRNCNTCTKWNK